MGREATCTARLTGTTGRRPAATTSVGKALLETAELLFKGDFRVAVPFKEMTAVGADASNLTVSWPGGTLVLGLGAQARPWAERIRNPPGRLDKLGVKVTSVAALVEGGRAGGRAALDEDELAAELEARAARVVRGKPDATVDLVFLRVERPTDLRALAGLRRAMRPDAAIWVLRPKGNAPVSEGEVRAAARAAGLVDIKIAAISASHTAVKLVIPVALRPTSR